MSTDAPTINLKDIWRIQYSNGYLLDPVHFVAINQFGMGEINNIVCMWRVKGYKTLIMLNELVLIPI